MQKFTDVFTEEEVKAIHDEIKNAKTKSVDSGDRPLGRLNISGFNVPESALDKIKDLAFSAFGKKLEYCGKDSCVIYSGEYGSPSLPPHFDGDKTEVIIDYQLSSNTTWDVGVDLNVFDLEDNSAVVFNPNTNIHWRPIKDFEDGEYVTMLFFRLFDPESPKDYSDRALPIDDEVFKEVNDFRESLISRI